MSVAVVSMVGSTPGESIAKWKMHMSGGKGDQDQGVNSSAFLFLVPFSEVVLSPHAVFLFCFGWERSFQKFDLGALFLGDF